MVKISKQQMNALASVRLVEFRGRLLEHLTAAMESRGMRPQPQQLERDVDEGLRRRTEYDIDGERDLTRYLEILFTSLGGFPRGAPEIEASEILRGTRASTAEKLDALAAWAAKRAADSAPPKQ